MLPDLLTARHSIRSYTPQPIAAETVRQLLEAAVLAPTAMHVEPWRFVIVQDRAMLKRISDAARAVLVREAQTYRDLHDPSLARHDGGFLKAIASPEFNLFYNAGTLILIGAEKTNPFVVADCWLAAENLMLAAAGMGLGTCCIGSAIATINSPEVATWLGIPAGVTIIAALIAGVPAERPAPSGRKAPVVLRWLPASEHN